MKKPKLCINNFRNVNILTPSRSYNKVKSIHLKSKSNINTNTLSLNNNNNTHTNTFITNNTNTNTTKHIKSRNTSNAYLTSSTSIDFSPLKKHLITTSSTSTIHNNATDIYHFTYSYNPLLNIKTEKVLVKSISELNKTVFQNSIFKGKKEVAYSKRDFDRVREYLLNKEEQNVKRAHKISERFNRMKKRSKLGNNLMYVPIKTKQSKNGITQFEFDAFKNKLDLYEENKSIQKGKMFAKKLTNIIFANSDVFPKRKLFNDRRSSSLCGETFSLENIQLKKNNRNGKKETDINFDYLNNRIELHNLMCKSGKIKPYDELEEFGLKHKKGDDDNNNHRIYSYNDKKKKRCCNNINSNNNNDNNDSDEVLGRFTLTATSMKYHLVPNFLKTKFKKDTLDKYGGIGGKYFGIPV